MLVHGAFADASSWNSVIPLLEHDGYAVVAAPNPLRAVRSDAAVVADVVKSVGLPAWAGAGDVSSAAASARAPVMSRVRGARGRVFARSGIGVLRTVHG